MFKNKSYYWACQIGGWVTYALTILFFSYFLQRELNALFIDKKTKEFELDTTIGEIHIYKHR